MVKMMFLIKEMVLLQEWDVVSISPHVKRPQLITLAACIPA